MRFISVSALILEICMIRNRPVCPIRRPMHRTSSSVTIATTQKEEEKQLKSVWVTGYDSKHLQEMTKQRQKERTFGLRTTLNRSNGIAKVVSFHFEAWLLIFIKTFQCQLILAHPWIFGRRWNTLYFGWKRRGKIVVIGQNWIGESMIFFVQSKYMTFSWEFCWVETYRTSPKSFADCWSSFHRACVYASFWYRRLKCVRELPFYRRHWHLKQWPFSHRTTSMGWDQLLTGLFGILQMNSCFYCFACYNFSIV